MIIPKYKSNEIDKKPIVNKIEIHDNKYQDKYLIWNEYINENEFKIYIERIDDNNGWGQILKIKLYNKDNNEYEIIQIGYSDKNHYENIIKTNILLLPIIYKEQKIPKKIIQTYSETNFKNKYHYQAYLSFIKLNPEYEYFYFTDKDCRKWITENYNDDTLYCYDLIIPNAFKADFFRICILLKWGGCYFDHKHILDIPLRDVIDKNDTILLCQDKDSNMMHNGIIIVEKNNKNLKNLLNHMKHTIKNKKDIKNVFDLTGPTVFYLFTYHEKIKFILKDINDHYIFKSFIYINHSNKILTYRYYRDYYNGDRKEDYNHLFINKQLYYRDYKKINNKIILSYPETYIKYFNEHIRLKKKSKSNHLEIYTDQFDFNIYENQLHINRIDKNDGWKLNLKIKIIDINTNTYKIYNIGDSDYNKKIINL